MKAIAIGMQANRIKLMARESRYCAIAILLLFTLKAGFHDYLSGDPIFICHFQPKNGPVIPAEPGDVTTGYSVLSNLLSSQTERNLQQNQVVWHAKHALAGLQQNTFPSGVKARDYIRYASAIKPSLTSTTIIFPFHTFI